MKSLSSRLGRQAWSQSQRGVAFCTQVREWWKTNEHKSKENASVSALNTQRPAVGDVARTSIREATIGADRDRKGVRHDGAHAEREDMPPGNTAQGKRVFCDKFRHFVSFTCSQGPFPQGVSQSTTNNLFCNFHFHVRFCGCVLVGDGLPSRHATRVRVSSLRARWRSCRDGPEIATVWRTTENTINASFFLRSAASFASRVVHGSFTQTFGIQDRNPGSQGMSTLTYFSNKVHSHLETIIWET